MFTKKTQISNVKIKEIQLLTKAVIVSKFLEVLGTKKIKIRIPSKGVIESIKSGLQIKDILFYITRLNLYIYWVQIELNDQPYAYQITVENKTY